MSEYCVRCAKSGPGQHHYLGCLPEDVIFRTEKFRFWKADIEGCTYQGEQPYESGRTEDELRARMERNWNFSYGRTYQVEVEYADLHDLFTHARARKVEP